MARVGRKNSIPAISHDTLRDGRKGDPQHECCGKKQMLLSRPPIAVQKTSPEATVLWEIYGPKKKNTKNTMGNQWESLFFASPMKTNKN